MLAHNTAGPKEDIVVPPYPTTDGQYVVVSEAEAKPVGFLASTVEEYVSALEFIFTHEEELAGVAERGRERTKIFSTERFIKLMKDKLVVLLAWRVWLNKEEKGLSTRTAAPPSSRSTRRKARGS